MKKSIGDFFKRNYNVTFTASLPETAPERPQLRGISCSRASLPENLLPALSDLQPGVLRFPLDSADRDVCLKFCRENDCIPHAVCDLCPDPEQIAVLADFPRRIIELETETDPGQLPAVAAAAAAVRAADPDAEILLPGMTLFGDEWFRAEEWNSALLRSCGEFCDALAIRWDHSVSGYDPSEGMETVCRLAEDTRVMLARMRSVIREACSEKEPGIAITGFSLQKQGEITKQDLFYHASVLNQLHSDDAVSICEVGPFFGEDGLVHEGFNSGLYELMLMFRDDQPVSMELEHRESKRDKLPFTDWEGKPLPLTEVSASVSPAGDRLFLLICNRHSFRRAYVTVKFPMLRDMYPVQADLLEGKSALIYNDAEHPDGIYCKEVKMRKYRAMDHVNLDVPQSGIVTMTLTIEKD